MVILEFSFSFLICSVKYFFTCWNKEIRKNGSKSTIISCQNLKSPRSPPSRSPWCKRAFRRRLWAAVTTQRSAPFSLLFQLPLCCTCCMKRAGVSHTIREGLSLSSPIPTPRRLEEGHLLQWQQEEVGRTKWGKLGKKHKITAETVSRLIWGERFVDVRE